MAGELIAAQVGANQILSTKIAAGEVQPEDLGLPVRNETGGILAAGSFVVVNSWNAAQDRALVVLADADVGGHFDVWFLSAALNNNANAVALKKGTLTAVNTAGSAVGNPAYLSTTAGGWTLTAPAGSGARQIVVGRVEVVDAAAGVVEVDLGAQRIPVKLGNADLQAGIVSADATGRALMAANVLDAATLTDKIAADAITAAVWEAKAAAGAISATVDGRASLAANLFDAATLADKLAADAITAAVWEAKAAAGAISATVDGRASLAANLLDAATFQDKVAVDAIGTAATSGAAKKFAAGAFNTAGLANVIADDAFTTAEFAAGAGGKFAAGALDAAGADNLVAVGAFGEDRLAQEISMRPAIAMTVYAASTAPAATALPPVGVIGISNAVALGQSIDITLPAGFQIRVLEAQFHKTDAAGGGIGTVTVQTGAGVAISDAMSTNIADNAIARAASIDDAQHTIAGGGVLRANFTSAANDSRGILYVSYARF